MAMAVDTRRLFPVAALVLALAVGARSATNGTVTNFTINGNSSSSVQVMSGLPLMITCRITYNSSTQPIVHIKKVTLSNAMWTVSENDEIADESLFGIWSAVATDANQLPPKTAEIVVTIPSAQNSDSGNYTCSAGSSASKKMVQVDVITEPTVALMTVNGQLLPPGQVNSVQVILGQAYSVSCNVSGGNPFPNVNISTSSGQLAPTLTAYNWTALSSSVSMGYLYRSTNVTVNTVVFTASMLGKPVTCTGGVKNPAAVSTSFTPISDAVVPQFTCDDKVMFPKAVKDLVISCQVFAPNLNSSFVRWTDSTKKNSTLVGDVTKAVTLTSDPRYTLRVTQSTSGSKWYTMELTVTNAHDIKDLSTISYQFAAVNNQGQALHIVTVQQDTAYVGAASQNMLSTVSYLLTLLIAAAAAALMM